MNQKKKLLILVPAAIAAAVLLTAGLHYWITYRKPNVTAEKILLVYKNWDYSRMMDTLESSGAIKNLRSFRRAARKREFSSHFEPGRYLLEPGQSNQEIIRMISNRWESPLQFRMRSHIRQLKNVAGYLGKNFEADSAAFSAALQDTALLHEIGFEPHTLIGLFIPNTYEIYWTETPENIIRRLKKEYDRFWNPERCAKAEKMGLDRKEVMTLASIVCEESNNAGELPKIAGVYMNRLRIGMPLQACPTVIYAHLDTEPGIRRVLRRHLKIDSPYNTYRHRGLPPGPITIPPVKTIDAVLDYQKSDYIYFCAKPEFDGTHNFSVTYSQHQKNARAYSRALSARNQ